MSGTDPGPRDHLVTQSLERDLKRLAAEEIDLLALDGAEAPDRLARHLLQEVRRELAASETSADDQAARVNSLLQASVANSTDAEVALPARLLVGIKGRS